MIQKNSSKLIEIDENLMKTKLFVTKIIMVTLGDINVNKNNFSYKKLSFHKIFIYFYQFTGIF